MNYTINLLNNGEKTVFDKLRLSFDFDDCPDWIDDEYIKINVFDFHRNYNFQKDLKVNFAYLFDDYSKRTKEEKKCYSEYEYYKEEKKQLAEIRREYHVFRLDFYEHSGIRFDVVGNPHRPICPYRNRDGTSYVGFVAVSKEIAKSREKALKMASNEIERYNNYINGEIYQYSIEEKETYYSKDLKKTLEHFDDYDSVGCFFELDDAKDEAIRTIKYYLNSNGIEYEDIELVESK